MEQNKLSYKDHIAVFITACICLGLFCMYAFLGHKLFFATNDDVMLKAIPSDYQYTIYPAVAFVADKDGNYDYTSGISPDELVDELTYVMLYPYGDQYEVLIQYILTQLY